VCQPANNCEIAPVCVEDGLPYSCNISGFCNVSNDACYEIACDPSGSVPRCVNVSVKNCNDNNPCTLDLCYGGQCQYQTCPYTDLCNPQSCNAALGGCEINAINCNDFNACTQDICVNGTCTHPPVNCDDGNNCTLDTCDPTIGCKNTVRQCNYTEYCLYYANGPASIPTAQQPCLSPAAAAAATNSTTGCNSYQCTNQTCRYYVNTCSSFFSNSAVLGATIGTGILVGIIIAAVICCGLAGGGAYAVYAKNPFEKDATIMNNPLYHGAATEVVNPLNKQC